MDISSQCCKVFKDNDSFTAVEHFSWLTCAFLDIDPGDGNKKGNKNEVLNNYLYIKYSTIINV